jgi:hypothetical protein
MRQRPKSLEFLEVLCGALRKIGARDLWQQRLAKDGAVEEGGNRDLGQWIVRALSVVAGQGRRQDGNEKLFMFELELQYSSNFETQQSH